MVKRCTSNDQRKVAITIYLRRDVLEYIEQKADEHHIYKNELIIRMIETGIEDIKSPRETMRESYRTLLQFFDIKNEKQHGR